MSDAKSSEKKFSLSKAVVVALPLLAASGMAATARNSSHTSSRRGGNRASVVHVTAQDAAAKKADGVKRSAFSAFGRSSGLQKSVKPAVDSSALAFLRENGLLQKQMDSTAQLSGELIGRKRFASESPFGHCHISWGTYYTNTWTSLNTAKCASYAGTWHAASTKPAVLSSSVINKTATSFDVSLTMSENSTVYAVLLLTTQPAPSSAQVIAGTDGSGAAAVQTISQAMNPSGTLLFTGLSSSASYMVYVVGRDASMEVTTTPKQVNPAYETGMIADTASWQFPKVRSASNGDFYLARADGSNIRFLKWNGAGFTLYTTLTPSSVPGRTNGGWGNQDSVDYEVDASGNIHVIFSAGTTNWAVDYDPFYAVYNGTSWTYTNIGETGYTIFDADLSLDPNGYVHTTFQGSAAGNTIRYATNKSGSWAMTTIASTSGGTDELFDSYVLADSAGTATVLYRREDDQNVGTDNYYIASSTDNFVAKTLVLDGKSDGKMYLVAGAVMDGDGNIHYAYNNRTDHRSYYRTNASGSWVQQQITNANYASVDTLDIERIDSTYYFASRSGTTYFLTSYDGSDWVDGFDFSLTGYLNDRFAISDVADRALIVSENSTNYTIHYHTTTIAGYITAAAANSAPTDIALTASSVNQSAGTNATVGTLSTTDADVGDTHTYSLVAGTGDTNNASFNISGSTLRANNSAALAAGTYSVRVQTSDGTATYAEAFTITVVDNVAPTVSSVSVPANDTYVPGESLSFTVNTGENITVNTGGGTPRLTLTIGSTTRYATYVSGSGTTALVFSYTVQAGDFDGDGVALGASVDLNGGTLRDAASNNLTLTLNSIGSLASVLVDAVAPNAPSTPDMTAGTDSGSSSTDNITSDTTPTFTGTAEANATVALTSSVSGSLGSTTADGSGNWSFTPGGALSAGAHTITATATDESNNTSSASSGLAIVIDTAAASGHSVNLDDSAINASEAGSTSFTFAGAEVGATYSYTISSSGGGTNVTGSGTIASASQQISGVNVSGLGDGTLTLSVVLTDAAGNAASAVTDTATLDAAGPSGHSIGFDDSLISGSEDNAISVTFASAEVGTTYSYTISSSGGGTNVIGSGTIATATDQLSGIDVSGLNDGTLTISVILTDTSGNAATAVTDTATLDKTALTGHSVGFNDSAISASEASAIAFTFAGAEVGATYSYTISSSGGGTNVTGSGTLASVSQQISNINVSGLGDGTLTLSVIVTDAAGNVASAVTNTATLDTTGASGHSVSFDDSTFNDTEASTASFTFASAEVGATYSYTISSSGGGTNVTGSGTVGSAGAQISNINVGGLNDGTLTLSVVLTDTAGNASAAVTDTATLDGTVPTVAISSGATNPTNAAFQATVSFSEVVSGFVLGDIVAGNASLSNLIDNNDGDFIVTVTPTTDGAVTLNVAANVAQDAAGNNNTVAIQYSTVFDGSGPVFSSSSPADNATTVQYNANLLLTFNESVSAGAGNISIYDAADDSLHESVAIGSASISGAGVTVNPSANFIPGHTYYVNVDAGLVEDALGNGFAGFSDETTLNFTVTNNVPTAAADSETTAEDNAVSISVLANDSDVDSSLNPASVTVVAQPAHGTTSVNTGTGVITFTPTANYNGSDSFTYTVGDTHGGTSSAATVSLTVTAVNDNPVAVADVESTPEDQPISIDVAANDTDVDTGDAADADTITLVSQPSNGTAAISNGEVLYTPDSDFFGSDSFTYQIQDQNSADSNVATVIVNVSGVNDAPTAANDSASTDEDTAVTIDLVDNDTDVDGTVDATAVTVMAQPAHGTVSINVTTGEATFTPTADYFGSDSFTYVVQDNEDATSATGTVSITIASVNDAPVAANDTVSLQEDTPHDINALGNDSDVDGTVAAASVEIVTAPGNGTTSVSGAGVITYTPGDDFNGSDSLTYRVQDNLGIWSAAATVAITVQSVNDEPLANDDSAQTDEDTAVIIDLLDNDSDVDGTLDATSISIVSAVATGSLTDNGDGTVTYTPAADTNGSDSFTYSVSDNQAGVSNIATVSIDVQAVNDAPVVSGSPTTELLEGEAYSFVPVITDVDNVSVTVTATNLPAWLILDADTGELSGTPAVGDAGDYADIVLSVSDGTDSTPLTAFSISVLGDNDTDGTDNTADTDDDNDGMSDTYEQTYGFNPLDGSDAAEDLDGDTISNLQESLDGTEPNDDSDYYDVTAPVVSAPDDLVIDAVALYTPVPLQQLLGLADDATSNEIATALGAITSDNVDGSACCGTEVVGVLNGSVLLAPGANLVTYEAVDAKGNVGTATQTVNVRPLVSVNKDQISVEGASVQFRVILNGQSPFYPLEVPFVIDDASTADDTDHDLVSGSVVFTETDGVGQTEAVVTVQLTSDVATEADELLIVRLDDQTSNDEDLANGYDEDDIFDINGGAKTSHVITITEQNVAPDVALQLSQNGVNTIQVTSDGGPVTLTATATDPNTGDSLELDWSASDNTLVDNDGDLTDETLVFNPSALSEGRYLAQVTVTDNEGATDTATLYFLVVAALPDLSDQEDTDGDGVDDETEGTADSDDDGIPDYQDNITAPNVLPEVGDQTESYLVECDPGVRCRLGQFALLGSTGGVRLESEDFAEQDDLEADAAFAFNGGIFDFEVHDLPTVGQSVRVVLPQANPIPQQAVYRKFLHGSWRTFVENANNAIHSAPGNPGYCPPPGDTSWQPGLNVGDFCVQLTLQDGGPNDGDGVANAAIEDPGGVAVQALVDDDVEQTFPGIKSKGKGGGGSLGVVALLMLAGLVASRRGKVTAKVASLGAALLATTAFGLLPAQSGHAAGTEDLQQQILERSYISVSFYQAKGSQGAGDFEQGTAGDGVTVNLNEYEESRTAWQIATGYRYLDWSAVELGYLDLGETQVDLDATGTASNLEAAMSEHYPVTGHGWTLANRFLWEVMPRVTLSGEVGLFIWEGEIDLTGADVEPDLDDGTDLLLGVACAYRLTDNLEAALHLKRVFFDDQEVDLLGVEGRFHF